MACLETLETSNQMVTHEDRPHTYSVCGKGFKLKGYINVHMKTHGEERPYTCELFGKGYKQSSCLRTHMRTHSGERPYTVRKDLYIKVT